jgi:DNA modification methylase
MNIEQNEVEIATEWSGKLDSTGAKWNLYCGDACKVLNRLKADQFRCVITSPPYYWQRDYGIDGQIGIEETIEEYTDAICNAMDSVKRVLHPKGVLFLNLGDTYYSGKGKPHGKDRKNGARRFSDKLRAVDKSGLGPQKKTLLGMPWRVAIEMIRRDWILRSSIIWRRENPIPEPSAKDRPRRSYEFVFMFSKSRTYNFNRKQLADEGCEDVWTIESRPQKGRTHPAVFPIELVERCLAIGNTKKGKVLDPFTGSGTVIQVATAKGLSAVGIDLNPSFCKSIVCEMKKKND